MSNAPPPFTPARSDLRDFGFMPLEVTRFRGSDLVAEAEPEAILAAIMLWTASWHETPAASLSDSDRLLAKAAGFGRSVDAWLAVKDEALRGWIKCSDGRLYHPVVARLANDAWRGKVEQRHRAELARRRKWNERHPDDPALLMPSFETFAAHYPEACPDDTAPMSQGRLALGADLARVGTGASSMPADDAERQADQETRSTESHKDKGALSQGQAANVTRTDGECSPNIGSKEQGEEQGQGESYRTTSTPNPPDDPPAKPEDLMAATNRIANAGGVSIVRPTALTRAMDLVKDWIANGISIDDTILPVIAKRLADMPDSETVSSLTYFDSAVRKAHAKAKPRSTATPDRPTVPLRVKDDDDPRIADIRATLAKVAGKRTYEGWLAPTAMSLNGSSLRVTTATAFMADWVRSHFSEAIAKAANVPTVEVISQ